MAPAKCRSAVRSAGVTGCIVAALCLTSGCGGSTVAPPEPDAKVRLTKLLRLYQVYVEKNKKGPASEEVLREFGRNLTAKERDEYLIGDDLDGIFTSPRDNQKYVVEYKAKPDPVSRPRAVAWEATGQGGRRYVALSIGYVEEYEDETFLEYKK
jgi:hypothetical protein